MDFNLKIAIGGGYAYTFGASKKQFDVAPIKAPYGVKEHRLTMVRFAGKILSGSLPMTDISMTSTPVMGWNLTGKRVEVWPDGKKMAAGLTGPSANDRKLIADLPALGGKKLHTDWAKMVRSRLTLRSGSLEVSALDLAAGAFTFTNKKVGAKAAQRLSGGIHGLHYTTAVSGANYVEFAVFPVETPDSDVDPTNGSREKILIEPGTIGIVVSINDRETGIPKEGDILTEFATFYTLLESPIDPDDQFIPVWSAAGGAIPVSPGSECAAGGYDDQNG